MNYPESQQILEEIKKANKILINCHYGADPDGIGSTLSMKLILEKMGKQVTVICPSKSLSKQTDYLVGYSDINLDVDFYNYDFSKFDLFIILDTSEINILTGKSNNLDPKIPVIVIDHHQTFELSCDMKILDQKSSSVGEILFKVYQDWDIDYGKDVADCLMTSIIGDTGIFSYPGAGETTLRIGADLISRGADKTMISNRIYRAEDFKILKFWSEVLSRMEIDVENHFVWSAVPYDVYKMCNELPAVKSKTASIFAPIVENTDFGFIAIEESPGVVSVSFRGRTDFDTSKIAEDLGGGGHQIASAVKMDNISFGDAVKKVLDACKKYARKD